MRVSFLDYDPTISSYRYIVLTTESPVLDASEGGPTDEGWSRIDARWFLDESGPSPVIRHEITTDGSDCDGRYSTHAAYTCEPGMLASREGTDDDGHPLPINIPTWRDAGHGQRDYAAEAAGY